MCTCATHRALFLSLSHQLHKSLLLCNMAAEEMRIVQVLLLYFPVCVHFYVHEFMSIYDGQTQKSLHFSPNIASHKITLYFWISFPTYANSMQYGCNR